MIQGREGLGFTGEALGKLGVVDALRSEELEGDEAVQGLLPRFLNDAHAAAAEAFENFKLRKVGGDLPGRQRRLRSG
jgi:hypothetical protein